MSHCTPNGLEFLFMRPKWEVALKAPNEHFEKFTDVPRLVVQILYNRGFTNPVDIDRFLNHQWPEDNPFALKGMQQAADRLQAAILNHEPIAVYGDYDADGVTSTALMIQLLKALGANAEPYIPNRFDEGYGLNNDALQELADKGIKLVLTVDCGIRSVAEVEFGNRLGLDIIITDHHHVGKQVPPALAVINPKQHDFPYPFKELAGVGLAFKLAQALVRTESLRPRLRQANLKADDYLDLVAMGTVADLAPLHGENRKLVRQGLEALNRSLRPGLQALISQTGASGGRAITASTIGFTIGPRLNAAGRLDDAMAALHLLLEQSSPNAVPLAQALDLQNRERQLLTEQTVGTARQTILKDDVQSPLYLISDPGFNPGVVGLAASRLTDEFYRPMLVAEQGETHTKGSARSIPEFHITEALDLCAGLLERYGGHAAAAGFTLKNENVAAFEARLLDIAQQKLKERQLTVKDLRPTILVDAEINLRGVNPTLIDAINSLQPFGYGNPTPRFLAKQLRIKLNKEVGRDGDHLKLRLFDGKRDWDAIAFRQGHWNGKLQPGQYIDAVFNLEFNEWNGNRSMQLNIKDLYPSED
jgi:single-stranded-DNA-specific exonuclease